MVAMKEKKTTKTKQMFFLAFSFTHKMSILFPLHFTLPNSNMYVNVINFRKFQSSSSIELRILQATATPPFGHHYTKCCKLLLILFAMSTHSKIFIPQILFCRLRHPIAHFENLIIYTGEEFHFYHHELIHVSHFNTEQFRIFLFYFLFDRVLPIFMEYIGNQIRCTMCGRFLGLLNLIGCDVVELLHRHVISDDE